MNIDDFKSNFYKLKNTYPVVFSKYIPIEINDNNITSEIDSLIINTYLSMQSGDNYLLYNNHQYKYNKIYYQEIISFIQDVDTFLKTTKFTEDSIKSSMFSTTLNTKNIKVAGKELPDLINDASIIPLTKDEYKYKEYMKQIRDTIGLSLEGWQEDILETYTEVDSRDYFYIDGFELCSILPLRNSAHNFVIRVLDLLDYVGKLYPSPDTKISTIVYLGNKHKYSEVQMEILNNSLKFLNNNMSIETSPTQRRKTLDEIMSKNIQEETLEDKAGISKNLQRITIGSILVMLLSIVWLFTIPFLDKQVTVLFLLSILISGVSLFIVKLEMSKNKRSNKIL